MKLWVHYVLVAVIALAAGFAGALLAPDDEPKAASAVSDDHIRDVAQPLVDEAVGDDYQTALAEVIEAAIEKRTDPLGTRLDALEGGAIHLGRGLECVDAGLGNYIEVLDPQLDANERICVVIDSGPFPYEDQ